MWWKILGALAGVALAGAASYVVYKKITADAIKEKARQLGKSEAFKAMIKSKNTRRVKVGIFDRNENEIADFSMESEGGVSENLRVGQYLYL